MLVKKKNRVETREEVFVWPFLFFCFLFKRSKWTGGELQLSGQLLSWFWQGLKRAIVDFLAAQMVPGKWENTLH